MSKWKKVLVELQEPLKISMMIFTPAVLLVLGGFHFMSPTVLSQLIDLRKEEVNKAVVKEVTERIDTVVDKKLKGKDIEKIKSAGSVTQEELEAINKSIQTQVQEETKKATKDELENLAKTLKADLYKDLSLSVIFAIASIFAAFAVKDILTEILKKEEEKALQDRIMKTLAETFGLSEDCTERAKDPKPKNLLLTMESSIGDLIRSNTTKMGEIKEELTNTNTNSFKDVKIQLGWIEYELASLALHKEEAKRPDKELTEHKCRIHAALGNLLEIDAAEKSTIQGLKDCENMYFVLADGEDPSELRCDNHNYKFEIMLARINLVLNNIDNPSREVSEIITSLKTRIAERQVRLSYHTEASDQINAGTPKYDRSE
jgi:hypothetical protein